MAAAMVPGVDGKEAAAARPLTAEEEALKRNTDCVYFLASPLTCKKGNECDYRHSEGARVNPRDCWYWLNGNCSNPNCLFRHPPLDGLFGVPGAASVTAPPSHNSLMTQIPSMHAPSSHNPNKQSVQCYFFLKGQCRKGDRCTYMHGPQPTGSSVPPLVGKVSVSEAESSQILKKSPWGLKESSQSIPKASVDKQVEVLRPSAKPIVRAETLPDNNFAVKRSSSPYPLENDLLKSHPVSIPGSSGIAVSMHLSQKYLDEHHPNGRDADEFLGESSPGFDVLVDDGIEDSDYVHIQNDFGRESYQGGRDMYPPSDFNYHHADYEPAADFDKDQLNEMDEYDRHGLVQNQYGRELRPSSERVVDRNLTRERRIRRRESPEKIDSSDLRYRLMKQRRTNGSRSTVSPDRRGETYRKNVPSVVEKGYRDRRSHRDQRHIPLGSSISTRLQGRITLPVVLQDPPVDSQSERERDRARLRGRLSPGRPIDYPGRHDRIKRKVREDFTADTRGQIVRTDETDSLNFAGPKSLAQLKGVKATGNFREQSASSSIIARLSPEQKSMKSGNVTDYHESDIPLQFEGPKPLSDILKRKRENLPGNSVITSNGDGRTDDAVGSFASGVAADQQLNLLPEAVKAVNTVSIIQEFKAGASEESEEEEGMITEAGEFVQSPAKATDELDGGLMRGTTENKVSGEEEGMIPEAREYVQSPAKTTVETEGSLIMGATENREFENSDRRNEESDYKAGEDEYTKVEDDESFFQEDEEELDDDEDDFARKVGAMFS